MPHRPPEPPVRSELSIRGIRARGRHGANPGERSEAQEFVVDVRVQVNVGSDELSGTVDYRSIVATVRRTVEATSYVLLESLAEAVAAAVAQVGPVLRATAVVHKPGAAASLDVADVAAEAAPSDGS